METNPQVKITKLESGASCIPNANLGTSGSIRINVNEILARLAHTANELFLLEWEGNKIPRGASINGKEIAWTQNGVVVSADNQTVGVYERLVEFGGTSGNEQKMIVAILGHKPPKLRLQLPRSAKRASCKWTKPLTANAAEFFVFSSQDQNGRQLPLGSCRFFFYTKLILSISILKSIQLTVLNASSRGSC